MAMFGCMENIDSVIAINFGYSVRTHSLKQGQEGDRRETGDGRQQTGEEMASILVLGPQIGCD